MNEQINYAPQHLHETIRRQRRVHKYLVLPNVWIKAMVAQKGIVGNICLGEYEYVQKLEKGQVVVDAGASVGAFTVKASHEVGEHGFVYAFEPEPESFHLLRENMESLENVKIFEKAVWSSNGEANLTVRYDNWSGHNLYGRGLPKEVVKVETVKLDDVIECKVDFLKMDVEAAELEALKGATRILKEHHPFIAIEIHGSILFNKVPEFLRRFGYELVVGGPCPFKHYRVDTTYYFIAS